VTTRSDAHRPEFHREHAWKHPVVAATTANITIATALNAGDVIDGVTLALNDRVLVKDQTTGAQNGIYDVGPSPSRSYDFDSGIEAWGCMVRVLRGTANGGKTYVNTNTALPTIGVTAITFAEFGASSGLTVKDEGVALATAATELDFVGAGVTASGTGPGKTITIPGGATVGDTSGWKPVMANDPLLITADGHAVWVPLTTVEGEPIMTFAPL
jgi:hypothetical protein